MESNYNPINFDQIAKGFSQDSRPNFIQKIGVNKLFLIAFISFLVALVFFIYTVIANRNTAEYVSSTPDAKLRTAVKQAIPQIRVITGGFRFNSLADINFVPKKVNKYIFENEDKILMDAKKRYPDFGKDDLKKYAARVMVTWASLRDFYSNAKSVAGANLVSADKNISFSDIDRELPILENNYRENEIKMSGFYLKTRFVGVFEDNLKKLGLSKEEIKPEAEKMINDYIKRAKDLSDPSVIVDEFNADERVQLINNEETSIKFDKYNLSPPLFDDPNFYKIASALKPGEFSPVYTLQTKNPYKSDLEDYAFVTYYISEKTGKNHAVDALVIQFLEKNWIR